MTNFLQVLAFSMFDDIKNLSKYLKILSLEHQTRLCLLMFGVSLFLVQTMTRAKSLGILPDYVVPGILLVQFTYCLVLILLRLGPWVLLLAAIPSAIIAHSFANLYWPSLRLSFPVQDFLLQDEVSSNYSFDMALVYLKSSFCFIPGACLFAHQAQRDTKIFRIVLGLLIAGFFINVIVSTIQGTFDLRFLASGSGTAVSSMRATALLEDGGASSVYFAAFFVGLLGISVFLFDRFRKVSFYTLPLVGLSLIAGIFSGGRTFFLVAIIAMAILGLTFIVNLFRQSSNIKNICVPFGVVLALFLSLVVVLIHFAPRRFTYFVRMLSVLKLSNFYDSFLYVVERIDSGRMSHYRAMVRDYLDHWLFGSGLGSFHANNLIYSGLWNEKVLIDNPSSLYLALLSALGICGVLIVLWFFLLFVRLFRACLKNKGNLQQALIRSFGFGVLLSLAISFCFGTHLIFYSVGLLLGVAVSAFASIVFDEDRAFLKVSKYFGVFIVTLLIIRVGILSATAPISVEFRWRERGKPQIPLSLTVPISAEGRNGVWLSSGGELLYKGNEISVFAEMPPEMYPLRVVIKIYDRDHKLAEVLDHSVENYQAEKPGVEFVFSPEEELSLDCARKPISDKSYCYFELRTDPVWFRDGQKVGAFVIENSPQ